MSKRMSIYLSFSNFQRLIDIEISLPDIISDLKELLISKLQGKLSIIYNYKKMTYCRPLQLCANAELVILIASDALSQCPGGRTF